MHKDLESKLQDQASRLNSLNYTLSCDENLRHTGQQQLAATLIVTLTESVEKAIIRLGDDDVENTLKLLRTQILSVGDTFMNTFHRPAVAAALYALAVQW